MRLDQLNGLLALHKVAEKKSFSAAALELRVSPSAMSQAVRQLESRLGVALLSRTTRSTRLTEAGTRFLERCGPALQEILASVEMVGEYAKTPSGLLRVTLPRMAYTSLIEPILPAFSRAHPAITVEFYLSDEFNDIIEEGFDAGIRLSESVSRDMTVLRLTKPFPFVVAGAPKYFERHGRPKRPEDLLDHNCIRYRFADGDVYEDWEFEREKKDFSVRVKGNLIVNDPHAVASLALQGLGLAYNSEDSLAAHVRAGKLEYVLTSYFTKSEGYFLYYPSRAQAQPKLRAFIEFFKKGVSPKINMGRSSK